MTFPGHSGIFALGVGGNAGQSRCFRSGGAAVRIMVRKAETSAGQTDVPAHGGKHHHRPVHLFAVLRALNTPAAHQHRALFAHQARQAPDRCRGNARNFLGPFCGLGCSVRFAQEIRQKLVVALCVLADELTVHTVGGLEFIHHRKHHRDVGVGFRCNPFALIAKVFCGIRL